MVVAAANQLENRNRFWTSYPRLTLQPVAFVLRAFTNAFKAVSRLADKTLLSENVQNRINKVDCIGSDPYTCWDLSSPLSGEVQYSAFVGNVETEVKTKL